eukprot:SAG22_NODE_1014_length_6027_cov_3.998988_10_plen_81_part_00
METSDECTSAWYGEYSSASRSKLALPVGDTVVSAEYSPVPARSSNPSGSNVAPSGCLEYRSVMLLRLLPAKSGATPEKNR